MAVDDAYQRLYTNQGTPGYYSGSPGGVGTQTYGPSPASAWGGSPIDLTGGSSYPGFSQGYPDMSQYPIFPGVSQGYPGGPQGYSQGYPGGYSQGYPGGPQGYSQGYPGGYSQGYPSGPQGYSQGYPGGYSQGYPGGPQGYSQGYPGGYSQGYPGGPQGYSQGYPGGYSTGYPIDPEGDPDNLNGPDDDTDSNTPMPSPLSNDDGKGTTKTDPGALTTPDAYKSLTQISHGGQWEAITGGADKPLTLDAAKNALSDPNSKLSDDTKKSLQWTVDNWSAVAGNGKSLNLDQAQNLGTTPPDQTPVPPPPKDDSNGAKSDGYIDNDTKQQSEGDCVFLSTTRGLSQTDQGRTDIKNAIGKENDDGSYDVKFKGSDKSYHVSKEDAEKQGQWANGDKDMQILGSAADQYFKEHGHDSGVSGLGFGDVSKLLTGKTGATTSLTGKNSVEDIKKQLMDAAPELGKTKSIGLSGGVGDNATWKAKDTSHEFQIESIDTKTGMVTYTNPWDTSVKHTISADDLAKQLVADPNGSTIDIFNAA